MVSDLQSRWPALFTINEINAEFMWVTTVPLLTTFLRKLYRYGDLHKVFSSKGGASGQKTSHIMAIGDMHCNPEEAERGISETTLGLYVIHKEEAVAEEGPADIRVVIEGVMLLHNLTSISFGIVMLFELIYALNLSYPQSLKLTFEFFQKVLMNLDGNKLSPKIQALKIKIFQ